MGNRQWLLRGQSKAVRRIEAFKYQAFAEDLIALGIGSVAEDWIHAKVRFFKAYRVVDLGRVLQQKEEP